MFSFVLNSSPAPETLREAMGSRFRLKGPVSGRDALAYLDTFDGALFRQRCALSVGRGGRRVRLTLSGADPEPLQQWVVGPPLFAWDLPTGPLRNTLSQLVTVRRLFPQVEVRAQVRRWSLLDDNEKTVARLTLREAKVRLPSQPARLAQPLPPFLLVTPLKGYEEEAAIAAEALRRALGLEPCSLGEVHLALRAVGKVPWPYSRTLDLPLDRESPAHLAVRQILKRLFQTLQENEEGILEDWDTEFLHDYRVALRRTRSALGQLKGVFLEEEICPFRERFRWLAEATGPLRDWDVQLLNLAGYRARLPPEAARALEPLARILRIRRKEAHRSLTRTLLSRDYRVFREAWGAFLERTHEGFGEKGTLPIHRVAGRRIRKAAKRVLRAGESISIESPSEELHRLRIACKKLRYLLVFFQSLYPHHLVSAAERQLGKLQDTLGAYNDLVVQATTLHRFARELAERGRPPVETLLAMGRLVGQLETGQFSERKTFVKRFRALIRRESLKSLMEILNQEGEGRTRPL